MIKINNKEEGKKDIWLRARGSNDDFKKFDLISKETYLNASQIIRKGIDLQYKEIINKKEK
ncbi:hypothetical protein [uncultured Anaerococcus sp.]|uniref:hypothetical protein n=1 Tax=uncultured Anaerococcus sp. TaxID=293428 RepID=UPI00262AB8B4|nr:hypothetical protein [uncultured Anaerococcus sp.]